ncbi:MAG TPA: hypothetical protein VF715_15545 [Thermoleophilaceae bacterium]|jgi:hypothetical protein
METQDAIPITARPYSERQHIVVVPDGPAGAAERDADKPEWAPMLEKVARAVAMTTSPIGYALVKLMDRSLDAARDQGITILPIGSDEAATLTFPPGHPKPGRVLYVGHPTLPSVYYPAASFHRLTFEHKLSEAVRLLLGLGATHIEVEREYGWSKEFAARLNVPLGVPGESVGIGGGTTRASEGQVLFTARLRNKVTPAVPSGLVWYPHEETWKTVADARLQYGLQEFSLTVNYEDDFGVDASLEASLAGTRIGLGGKFVSHEATSWRMVGTFDEADASSS